MHALTKLTVLLPLLMLSCGESGKPRTDGERPAVTAAKADASSAMIHRWKVSPAEVWRMRLSSTLKDQGGHSLLALHTAGDLKLQVKEVTDGRMSLLLALVSPTVEVLSNNEAGNADKVTALQEELQQVVQGEFRDGVLERMTLPRSATAFAVGIWRVLFTALQTPVPEGGAASFEAVEPDANGIVRTHYEQQPDGSWVRTKRDYVRGLYAGLESDNPTPEPKVIKSNGHLRTEGEHLQEVVLEEQVSVHLTGDAGLRSETSVSLTRSDGAPATDLVPAEGAVITLRADEPWQQPLPIDAMDSSRMEGLTFDEVLAALVARGSDPGRRNLWGQKNDAIPDPAQQARSAEWMQNWSRYFSALPAFFRQEPGTLKRAEKEIRQKSPATTSLLGGLSSSGIQEAQIILLRLATDERLEEPLREAAIRNLVQCRLPTAKTAGDVRKLYGHPLLTRYAVFGTGIIARHLREEGMVEDARTSMDWLQSLLTVETDNARRRDIFRGIANGADSSVVPSMKAFIASGSDEDRAGAIEALRLLPSLEVDTLIADHIDFSREPSISVRLSALAAASVRDIENPLRQSVIDAATGDPEKRIRSRAGQLLKQWQRKDPTLKAVVETLQAAQ